MKTKVPNTAFRIIAVLLMAALSSCVKEDDQLQLQLIEARAALESKTKALEKAESMAADLEAKLQQARGGSESTADIAKIKARNTELEQQLASARSAAEGATQSVGKIDMDAMASKLEDDLTQKARGLRDLVEKQITNGRIDESSLKSVNFPKEIVAPFTSSINFTVLTDAGKTLSLVFPVSADLGGTWKIPGPDEVQKAYLAAQSQTTQIAATTNTTTTAPNPQPGNGRATMKQVDGNTYQMVWPTDAPGVAPQAPSQASAPAPAPYQPAAPTPQPYTPPAAPTPSAPSIPAPVMPVQRDVIIRF